MATSAGFFQIRSLVPGPPSDWPDLIGKIASVKVIVLPELDQTGRHLSLLK